VRGPAAADPLRAEHPASRSFLAEYLETDLALLAASVFNPADVAALRRCVEDHAGWLDAPEARLAHGDFDTAPILHADGRYTGIIDFSEVRGTGRLYDLGHFHLHDGQRLPAHGFRWLAEGYQRGAPPPADYEERVAFQGLLIGLRRLARSLRVRPEAVAYQRLMSESVRRELALLA
jgi:aminoglycoside phosphotransferase (APT) family kinase protein